MVIAVGIERVRSRRLAAVRRELFPREVAVAWRPAVDLVWEFIRSQPGLWRDGHNVFVYHHPTDPDGPMVCEFGVEVTRTFDRTGQVYTTATPAGEAVVAVYRGPYRGLNEAYRAIEEWMTANGRESGGPVWEIYGDPTPDPSQTETAIVHLLRPRGG